MSRPASKRSIPLNESTKNLVIAESRRVSQDQHCVEYLRFIAVLDYENGAPGVIRTLGIVLRRHTLDAAELRARRAAPLILKHFSIPQQSVSSSIGQSL